MSDEGKERHNECRQIEFREYVYLSICFSVFWYVWHVNVIGNAYLDLKMVSVIAENGFIILLLAN